MLARILAITALSLTLGGAAFAQDTPAEGSDGSASGGSPNESIESQIPPGWDDNMRGVFFSDPATFTLRTQEEIATGWASMSAEQQAMVRADCESGAYGVAGAADTESDSIPETTAGIEASGGMGQLCEWVNEL